MTAEPMFIGCAPRDAWPQMTARLLDAVRAGRTKMISAVTLRWMGEIDGLALQHIGEWFNTGIEEMPGVGAHSTFVLESVKPEPPYTLITFQSKASSG